MRLVQSSHHYVPHALKQRQVNFIDGDRQASTVVVQQYQNKGEVMMSSVMCSLMMIDTNSWRAAVEETCVNWCSGGPGKQHVYFFELL